MYSPKGIQAIFLASSVGHLIMTVLFISHTDYRIYYTGYWTNFLETGTMVTYPPGFYLFFAHAFRAWYFLPKLMFTACFLVANYQLMRLMFTSAEFQHVSIKIKVQAIISILLSPLLAKIVWTGLYDSVVGLIILNLMLVFVNRKMNRLLREVLVLSLIGLAIITKFIGAFLIFSYLLGDIMNIKQSQQENMFKKRHYMHLVAKIIILGIASASIVMAIEMIHPGFLATMVEIFWVHTVRDYRTFYNIVDVFQQPFGIAVAQACYSIIGFYAFMIALGITYAYIVKKNLSFDAIIPLAFVVYFAFFKTVHDQFLLWAIFIIVHYYIKHTPEDPIVIKKLWFFQTIGFLTAIFVPFGQFIFVYFILDIFNVESRGLATPFARENIQIAA